MRLLPRTPRGTWLLAGAVWLAGCGALWWVLPPAPRAEWRVFGQIEHGARRFDSHPSVWAVRPDRGAVAVVGEIHLWRNFRDQEPGLCGPVQILDLETGRERRRYFTGWDTFWDAVASPDNRWLALLGNIPTEDNWSGLVIIDLDRDYLFKIPDATYHGPTTRRLAFLPDSSTLIYPWRCGEQEGLRVFDLSAQRVVAEIKDAAPPVAVADGGGSFAYVARSDDRCVIRIAEWPSLRTLAEVTTGKENVFDLNVSTDSRHVAAVLYHTVGKSGWGSTWVKSIHCWDANSGAKLIQKSGDHFMRLTADGETLMTYSWQSGADPSHLVAWDLSAGRARWERNLSMYSGANLGGTLPDCVTLIRSHDSSWETFRGRARQIGVNWPFSQRRTTYTSELIDIRSGQRVVGLPFAPGRLFRSPSGLITVAVDFEMLAVDIPPRIEVWDYPPRKSLKWFVGVAAPFALPSFLIARRRVRRLRREAAA